MKKEIEIKLKITVECDGEKLEAIHGDKWMECFLESAYDFADNIQQYADKHPFSEGCKVTIIEQNKHDIVAGVPTVNDQIMKLYLEAAPDDLLHSDLIDEGIKTLEAAYVQGFHHGLAELKMRLA